MQVAGLSESTQLAAFILLQRALGPRSLWHPYISVLPASYSTAVTFTSEEIQHLRGAAKDRATALLILLRREFIILRDLVHEWTASAIHAASISEYDYIALAQLQSITWDDFVWAYSSVSSRAVSYPYSTPGGKM